MQSKLSQLSKWLLLIVFAIFTPNTHAQISSSVLVTKGNTISFENPYLYGENFDLFDSAKNEPSISTQKRSFTPDEIVYINGDEFESFERVRLTVSQLNQNSESLQIKQWDTYADGKGRIVSLWELNNEVVDANDFVIVAEGTSSNKSTKTWISTSQLGETISKLQQCANGPGLPQGQDCPESGPTGWVSGLVGASKSQYIEGDSITYRVILDDLDVGDVYEYTFGWDVTKGGLNAIDYLTTYNRSISNANPCKGTNDAQVAFHCTQGTPTATVAVPIDSIVTSGLNRTDEGGGGDDITQVPGVLTMWGGDMNESGTNDCTAAVGTACGLSAYNYTDPVNFPAGDSSSSITITFMAKDTKMVLAWGGHIAERSDWGRPNGSVNITGAPYHMFNMSGNNLSEGTTNIFSGNREVQLSTASIIAVGRIIIYKHVSPALNADFKFTGNFSTNNYTSGSTVTLSDSTSDFTHTPGGANPSVPANSGDDPTYAFNDISDFTTTKTISETLASGFSADGIACSVTEDFGGNNDTTFPSGSTAPNGITTMDIDLGSGDEVTCTYFSSFVTAADVSIDGRVFDANGTPLSNAVVSIIDDEGNTRMERTNHFGHFRFAEIQAGTSLLLNVMHKNYEFSPQFVTLNDDLNSFEIMAN